MHRLIILVSMSVLFSSSAIADECSDGLLDGQLAANQRGVPGAIAGGIAGGVLFSLLGTGAAAGISAIGNPTPPLHIYPRDKTQEYERCFVHAYQRTMKGKRAKAATLAGLVPSSVWLLLALL
jgi:hypothetical protein